MAAGGAPDSCMPVMPPGWARHLRDVAALTRRLGLEVRSERFDQLGPGTGLGLGVDQAGCALVCAQHDGSRVLPSCHPSIHLLVLPTQQAVSEEAYAAVVCRHLRERLVNHVARAFDRRMLEPALRCSASTPIAFLRLVLPEGVSTHRVTC